jgi:hypothetical protein
MGRLEDEAIIIIIRTIEQLWPCSGRQRGRRAEYMALHLMRGPSWRN